MARPLHPAHSTGVSQRCAAFMFAMLVVTPLRADTITLNNGSAMHGKIESDTGDRLRFRTDMGLVEIKRTDIKSITRGPAPWEEYDKVKADYPDTADGHFRLAVWCRDHALTSRARQHFRRVLRHDPEHEPAHRALGHVKTDTGWREAGRGQASSRPASQPAGESDEQKLLRRLITQWHIRINAIYEGRFKLRGPGTESFEDGRRQILAIRDPLAIPGLTAVLSRSDSSAVRLLMIEALSQFREDEAIMNLVVIALLDPDPSVRRCAAEALVPRKDERVAGRLRHALSSDEDTVVRNAARALGVLRAREAVEELAAVLYTIERRRVRYRRTEILGSVVDTFGGRVVVNNQGRILNYIPYGIGVLQSGTLVGTRWVDEVQDVRVVRTDVQEALIAITGQNFGFDADAWIRWSRENP